MVKEKSGRDFVVLKDTSNTKQQLTDIYNKAQGGEPPIPPVPPIPPKTSANIAGEEMPFTNQTQEHINSSKEAGNSFFGNLKNKAESLFTKEDFTKTTLETEMKGGLMSEILKPAKNLPSTFQNILKEWKTSLIEGKNRADRAGQEMKTSLDPITEKRSFLEKMTGSQTSIGESGKKFIEFMKER